MAVPPFSPGHHELIVLKDGTRVELRAVTPDARALFERGIEELSPESQYRRFFTEKSHFTDAELDYLTHPDGTDHVAIGAVLVTPDGAERGVGVGRFIRDAERSDVAEPAVVVVDAFQNRGLGRILLDRLVEAAADRDITWFRTEVLASNKSMLALIDRIAPDKKVGGTGPVLTVDFPLPAGARQPAPTPRLATSVQRLLAAAADGRVVTQLARRIRWLFESGGE